LGPFNGRQLVAPVMRPRFMRRFLAVLAAVQQGTSPDSGKFGEADRIPAGSSPAAHLRAAGRYSSEAPGPPTDTMFQG